MYRNRLGALRRVSQIKIIIRKVAEPLNPSREHKHRSILALPRAEAVPAGITCGAAGYDWQITGGNGAIVFPNGQEAMSSTTNSITVEEPSPTGASIPFNIQVGVRYPSTLTPPSAEFDPLLYGPAQDAFDAVQITDADLESNDVKVTLSGPQGTLGAYEVIANGTNGSEYLANANNGQPVGPGSYIATFNRPLMPPDTYTSVTAIWNTNSGTYSVQYPLSRTWWVQGLTYHTQYNTPRESLCTTPQATAYIYNPSTCVFTPISMSAQFISQAILNGTGIADVSDNGTLLHGDSGQCKSSYPSGASPKNSFYVITAVTGSCHNTLDANSVATYENPQTLGSPWNCGDNLLVVNSSNSNVGIYDVQDGCPACKTWPSGYTAHVDHYNTSNACSLTNLPGNWSADTH